MTHFTKAKYTFSKNNSMKVKIGWYMWQGVDVWRLVHFKKVS